MTDVFFFICPIKSPQCTDKYSKKKHIRQRFSCPMFWSTKNVKFHFLWGTKPRDPNQETGYDCDVISGLKVSRKTDFSDIFSFSYKQRNFVLFLGKTSVFKFLQRSVRGVIPWAQLYCFLIRCRACWMHSGSPIKFRCIMLHKAITERRS